MSADAPRTLIIAEAGVNHNGDMALALQLIDVAAEAGADIIKFQTFKADAIAVSWAPKAPYQKKQTMDGAESQLEMLRRLELDPAMHETLSRHCEDKGITFLSTPFDFASISFLNDFGLPLFKIPSGEITNLPYLRAVGALGKELLLSTGMSDLSEVAATLSALNAAGTPSSRITLLHCTTEYPAPFASVNLRALKTMREAFPEVAGIGYSDHTEGIEVPIAAVALGATVIEKHFTLNRNLPGPDHKASVEPHELKMLCNAIRNIEKSLGDGEKRPMPAELANRSIARKSIVAARDIAPGEILSEENLTTKRPGNGISPMLWDAVLGTKAARAYRKDDQLCEK